MNTDNTTYEDQLPAPQKWTNAFLENWIFAFIVAMVIRQFFLEPFSIPSASMEPMLLGSQIMSKSDHVVVNKLTLRFSESKRWDVTVFEFPIPEFRNKQGGEHQIFSPDPSRAQSHWLTRPLLHRSFVKRLVVIPEDTFYVSAGDLYVQGANGGSAEEFDIPQKDRVLQDSLWQTMYEHGVMDDYVPWSQGATIDGTGGASDKNGKQLKITSSTERAVFFTQPLSNLYMKEWVYNVVPVNEPFAKPVQATLSMTKPLFHYQGQQGNAWNQQRWSVNRLSAKDLDNNRYGVSLNSAMKENIGDMRIVFRCTELTGVPELSIVDRDGITYQLQFTAESWSLRALDTAGVEIHKIASGTDSILNKTSALVRLDNRVWFEIDNTPLHEPLRVQPCKNVDAACRIKWSGKATVHLSDCRIERDVHYCRSGFLEDLTKSKNEYSKALRRMQNLLTRETSGTRLQKNAALWGGGNKSEQEFTKNAQRVTENVKGVHARAGVTRERQALIRERLLGRPARGAELYRPIGDSADTALTAPDNGHLLFGDNSPFSWDSRNWGWVPGTNIRGRAAWVVFPISRWKTIR